LVLNNLGSLYDAAHRLEESEANYNEALAAYRRMEDENPGSYLTDVADVLNELGTLYEKMARPKDSKEASEKAMRIRHELLSAKVSE
jgi:tetratricopeptide (TPR) repeat protein